MMSIVNREFISFVVSNNLVIANLNMFFDMYSKPLLNLLNPNHSANLCLLNQLNGARGDSSRSSAFPHSSSRRVSLTMH